MQTCEHWLQLHQPMSLSTSECDRNCKCNHHTASVPSRKNTVLLSGKQINYATRRKTKGNMPSAFVPLLQAFCEELQLCLTKSTRELVGITLRHKCVSVLNMQHFRNVCMYYVQFVQHIVLGKPGPGWVIMRRVNSIFWLWASISKVGAENSYYLPSEETLPTTQVFISYLTSLAQFLQKEISSLFN